MPCVRGVYGALALTFFGLAQAQMGTGKQEEVAAHRPLPNTEELRKEPVAFKPFTILELRSYSKSLKSTSTVTLLDGRKIKAAEFVEYLNKYEKLLTAYGYSLRDSSKGTIVLDRTYLRLKSRDKFAQGALTLEQNRQTRESSSQIAGRLKQFPDDVATWTIMDPSLIGVSLKRSSSLSNGASKVRLYDDLGLTAYVLGNAIPLVQVTGSAAMPTGMISNDPSRAASTSLSVLGVGVGGESSQDGGSGAASASLSVLTYSVNPPPLKYPTTIGPIPVELQVGFKAFVGAKGRASASILDSIDEMSVNGGASVFLRALLGNSSVVAAGAEASLDLVKYTYKYINQASMQRLPAASTSDPAPAWEVTQLSWQVADGYQIESGSGAVSLVVVIGTGFFKKSFSKEIIAWDGHVWTDSLNLPPASVLIRPAGCGAPFMQKSMCAVPPAADSCFSLLDSPANCGGCGVTCGSDQVCTNGMCQVPPNPHTCPAGTQCCGDEVERPDGKKGCLDTCYAPGHHLECQ